MTFDIEKQDGKEFTRIAVGKEPFGYALPEGTPTYGTLTDTNLLKVSDNPPHAIYYQEYGNSKGEPVMVLHGGPGGGGVQEYAKFFNPDHYRIIVASQRGCEHCVPEVNKNPDAALAQNDTPHLIEDIEKLRAHLGIEGKMHVFGGSWGSTLSLAYAIEHPENVKTLQLRGIFLGKENTFDYFYQGNAATYKDDAYDPAKPFDPKHYEATQDLSRPGTYRAYTGNGDFPLADPQLEGRIPDALRTPTMAKAYADAWHRYVTMIPADEKFESGPLAGHFKREDMVAAYSEIFEKHTEENSPERAHQIDAAKRWAIWEGTSSYLIHDTDPKKLGKFDDDNWAVNFARIENRYFMHGCYLGMKSGQDPEEFLGQRNNNFILENLHRIKDIPTYVVHGGADQVTLLQDAYELKKGMEDLGGKVELTTPPANHSCFERANTEALVANAEKASLEHPLTRADKLRQPKPTFAEEPRNPAQRDGPG